MKREMHLAGFILAGVRNKVGRNLATVFCFAFIAANIFSAQYLTTGTAGSFDVGVSRMGADLLVVPAPYAVHVQGKQMSPASAGTIIRVEPSTIRFNSTVMDKIARVPDVADFSAQLFVASVRIPGQADPADVYGIDPVTDFTVRPWLQERLKAPLGPGQAIIGSAVPGDVSSQITVGVRPYTIAGRLNPTNSAVDRSVFVTLDDAYTLAAIPGILSPSDPEIRKNTVNGFLVRAEPGSDPELVGARIQQPFSYEYLRVMQRHFTLTSASQAAQGLPGLLKIVSLVVVLAAMPLIALISAMVANERQREIGLLISMGAQRRLIFVIVMAESLILAFAGGVIGTVSSLTALFLLNDHGVLSSTFHSAFVTPGADQVGMMAATALGIVIIIGTVASFWPAYRSSRLDPFNAIRMDE
jgi:putative ABC transport system permease protein